jgi:hypothetical protein
VNLQGLFRSVTETLKVKCEKKSIICYVKRCLKSWPMA